MSPKQDTGQDTGRTLLIIKPDGVERGLVGEVLARVEAKGLRLVAAELKMIGEATAGLHYQEHKGKPFYEGLVAFITRSPVLVAVLEGPAGTWKMLRQLMGATNPADAAPGTIRGDLATTVEENLVHGSDSEEAARAEISLFFPEL
ncbi:MAG: nucleoside-diphosphate kinase [Acidimicrobiales bacterium]